jgi:tRNA threonylcarbamoyladenosine biosynthesis protein TsaB
MTTASAAPPAPNHDIPTAPAGGLWLALDTSGSTARVGLADAEGRPQVFDERTSLRHSATLLPLCHELFGRAGISAGDLRGIACGSGPGSFTGLRVGMAVAKGLALAFDLSFVLVSSLTALGLDLAATPGGDLLIPCIDAGKGEVYAQLFQRTSGAPVPLGPELRLTPEALAGHLQQAGQALLVGGTGADRHAAALTALLGPSAVIVGFPGPSAGAIARLGVPRLSRGERDDLDTAVPSYGRPPDITTPKRPVP